jgi:hypothetical protein
MEQHMIALEKANECRLQRAQLKREIKAGEVKVSEVLDLPIPEWLRGEVLGRFIRQMPRFGPDRMRRFLIPLNLPELKTLGGLTYRQRTLLVRELRRIER